MSEKQLRSCRIQPTERGVPHAPRVNRDALPSVERNAMPSDKEDAMTTDPVFAVRPIGVVRSSYTDLAELPPQAAANAVVTAAVIVREEMTAALLGLDRYRAIWLLTWLDAGRTGDPPLQLVPRATQATGEVQGVFASRAPARPNAIGLHLVRLVRVADNVVTFAGVDLLDGTPVLDIKPWFADCDLPANGS